MTATTGLPGAGLRRLVLDVDAWAQLVELADAAVPADFAVRRRVPGRGFPATAEDSSAAVAGLGEDVLAEADSQALQRLRAGGLVDGAGQVHPGMAGALSLLGAAPVRVRVRSWSGDRVVLGALALGPDGGVGLARLRRVRPRSRAATGVRAERGERVGEPGPEVEDAVGVELSVLPAELTLGGVRRLLPGLAAGPVTGAGVSLPWVDLLPLVEALRVARRAASRVAAGPGSDLADGVVADLAAQVDAEVVRLLARDCGVDGLPSWLRDLSAGLESVVEITVVAAAGTRSDRVDGQAPDPAVRVWFGMWVGSGGHLVCLGVHATPATGEPDPEGPEPEGPEPRGPEPGGPEPGGAVPGGAVPGGAVPGGPEPGGAVPAGGVPGAQDAVIDLVETDEAGLLREVGSVLAEALAWGMGSAAGSGAGGGDD